VYLWNDDKVQSNMVDFLIFMILLIAYDKIDGFHD